MELFAKLVLGLALIVAIVFALLVLVTGKGDAMSGGGSVRTTFKGKASFDDIISKWTLYMGVSFMGLVLLYTVVANRVGEAGQSFAPSASTSSAPSAPSANQPSESTNSPAANAPAPTAPTNTGATKPSEGTNSPAPDANAPAKK